MQTIRKKKQKMTKEIQTKYRNEKFSSNRKILLEPNERQSLLNFIFYVMDQDKQQITPQQFEDFLDCISEEIKYEDQSERVINDKLICCIAERYASQLKQIEQIFENGKEVEGIQMIKSNPKMFNLVRFLLRLGIIKEIHLKILESLLYRIRHQVNNILEDQLVSNVNNDRVNQFFEEFMDLLQMRHKIYQQLYHLHFLISEKYQQEKFGEDQLINKPFFYKLISVWMRQQLPFGFLFHSKITFILGNQKYKWNTFKKSLTKIINQYLNFICIDRQIQEELFDLDQIQQKPQKILVFLTSMLFSVQTENQVKQIQLSSYQQDHLSEQLIVFLDLSLSLIKKTRQYQSKQRNKIVPISSDLLDLITDCYIDQPSLHLKKFAQKIVKYQSQNTNLGMKEISNISAILFNQRQKRPQVLVIKLLKNVEEMEHQVLCSFLELLSILISKTDKPIPLLFQTPPFEAFQKNKKLDFSKILTKLITHLNIEIRRQAFWLLSNIAGSQDYYQYSLQFIDFLFTQNIVEKSCTSFNVTNMELIVMQQILQTIMNYLSNIKSYHEIDHFLQLTRTFSQSQSSQSMFVWVIRLFSHSINDLAENFLRIHQNQRFFEILIYSLYNVLSLVSDYQINQNKQNVVLSVIQSYEIPKYLDIIYLNVQTNSKSSNFFTMIENLLDQVQKLQNNF